MLELYPGDGCGNHFLLARAEDVAAAGEESSSLAQRLCGSTYDGLLELGGADQGAQGVRIFNADGSDGGACLNGLRVAACFTQEPRGRLSMAGHVVDWRRVAGGFELQLRLAATDLVVEAITLNDGRKGHAVAFWNPHAVFAFDGEEEECNLEQFDLSTCAERVRRHQYFPAGVNVEMVAGLGLSDELQMRVLERGVGETRSCGSGALAVAAVAWGLGAGHRIGLQMAGGRLEIERAGEGLVRLRGAARTSPGKSLPVLLRGACKVFP